ncbi:diguanylate cyclase (GGDEF) domain-containing protein [Eubacterium ruminantium]|nr:diguanylate cyclase (GGDEF) domain-containing protein [Eubacterium ruminantium]
MVSYLSTLAVLFVIVIICIVKSYSSNKTVAAAVRLALYAMLVPVVANAVIAISDSRMVNYSANIFYLVGTNLILMALMNYIVIYCEYNRTLVEKIGYFILIIDSISVFLNPVLHHVYGLEKISLKGDNVYYTLDSYWYHYIHLDLSFIVIVGLITAVVKKIHYTSKLYMERYLVIGLSFVYVVIQEFTNTLAKPVYNKSMFGFMICGILIYIFSIEYHQFFLTHKMFDQLFKNMNSAVFFYDNHFNCLYMNPASHKMFDIQPGEYEKPKAYLTEYITENNLSSRESFTGKKVLARPDRESIFQVEFRKLFDKKGRVMGAYVILSDRTEEEKKAAQDRYRADHDMLTGLYNPGAFHKQMQRCLHENPDREYLIVATNIKDFKLINDVFGRNSGDSVLQRIAETLKGYSEQGNIIARLGADKFVMFVDKQNYDEEALINELSDMVWLDENKEYSVIIHLGVYEVKDRTIPGPVMVDRAFMALNGIKSENICRAAWYSNELRESLIWEQTVSRSLDEAMHSGQIIPFLQAQVNTEGKVEGAEVLVRWQHPTEGLMAPGRFISILEQDGHIVDLDMFMWEEACKILHSWKNTGLKNMYLSVNISPKDFYFVDVYEVFTKLVRKYDIPPKMLRLEITESVMMTDVDMKMKLIDSLREYGFIVEMDDFGSGYSSLNLLKDMPVDILKIDMAFLRKTRDTERAKIILQQIVCMAQKLIIPVISEGVETEEQVRFLTDIGCNMFQGYYFARPISLSDFEERYKAS